MSTPQSDPLDATTVSRDDSSEDLFASAMENIDITKDGSSEASQATTITSQPPLQEDVPLNDDEDWNGNGENDDEEQVPTPPQPIATPKLPEYEERSDQVLEISVSDPQKVGEGMVSYVVYKVTTKTNLPYFKRRESVVTRRFSDFLGLHDKLVEKYLHSGRIIPPAPEKNALGTTKVN
jgi:sorting nexin-1/2